MGMWSNMSSVRVAVGGHQLAILSIVKSHKLILNFRVKNKIYLYIINLSDLINVAVI